MSLAQVIYNISSNNEFAAKWQVDPHNALKGCGFTLSREELAFLSSGISNQRNNKSKPVSIIDLTMMHRGWM